MAWEKTTIVKANCILSFLKEPAGNPREAGATDVFHVVPIDLSSNKSKWIRKSKYRKYDEEDRENGSISMWARNLAEAMQPAS